MPAKKAVEKPAKAIPSKKASTHSIYKEKKRGLAKKQMSMKKEEKLIPTTKPIHVRKKRVERGVDKKTAHVDNVKGEAIRVAKHSAHFPVDQDDIRLRRARHSNFIHEKSRQDKPQVAHQMGRVKFSDAMKTFQKVFDPSDLTTGAASALHKVGRIRNGPAPLKPAKNEVEVNIRAGGGSNVARSGLGDRVGLE